MLPTAEFESVNTMRKLIRLLSVLALLMAGGWSIASPGWEPLLAVVTAVGALAGTFLAPTSTKAASTQSQDVGTAGFGIQAGRDVNVHDIEK